MKFNRQTVAEKNENSHSTGNYVLFYFILKTKVRRRLHIDTATNFTMFNTNTKIGLHISRINFKVGYQRGT